MNDTPNSPEWYRKYSEIDYFLTSDLRDSSFGIVRLLQRIELFEQMKQHIPYLLLIHLINYNTGYDNAYKNEILKKLLSRLSQKTLNQTGHNQLLDFIPPFYVIQLLIELQMKGYAIELLIRKLETNPGEDPVFTLKDYGNYAIEGFPETLLYLFNKLVYKGRDKDKLVWEIANAALGANNLKGFEHLFSKISNNDAKTSLLLTLSVYHVNKNEIDKALKLKSSFKKPVQQSNFYLSIAIALAHNGKIDVLKELKFTNNNPTINLCILNAMIRFYIKAGNQEIASKLFSEAVINLDNIKDKLVRSFHTIYMLVLALKLGKQEYYSRYLDTITFYMRYFHKDKELEILRYELLEVLLLNNKMGKAKELNDLWNLDKFNNVSNLTYIISEMLRNIDYEMSKMNISGALRNDEIFEKNYKVIIDVIEYFPLDVYKEDSLHAVSLNLSKYGFYKQALDIRNSIKEDFFARKIDTALPFYALNNGHTDKAIEFARDIKDEKTRLDVMLCMTPFLEKTDRHKESFEMIRNWAMYNFDTI